MQRAVRHHKRASGSTALPVSESAQSRKSQLRLPGFLTAARGSGAFALISASTLAAAIYLDSRTIREQLPLLWQPTLMIVWLVFGSLLISRAQEIAEDFEAKVSKISGGDNKGEGRNQPRSLVSRWSIVVGAGFAGVGIVICSLLEPSNSDVVWIWKLTWSFTVAATFYYAGFGIWGSWIVTRRVATYAEDALERNLINEFHGDGLGGLAFVRQYADTATIFMASGIAAFPMGVFLGNVSLGMNSRLGYFLAALIGAAILVWGVFSFLAALSGRVAVARAVRSYRSLLLDQVALEKRSLINVQFNAERLEMLRVKEEALERLNVGVLKGAGAWKDFFAFGATIWTMFVYASDVNSVLSLGLF